VLDEPQRIAELTRLETALRWAASEPPAPPPAPGRQPPAEEAPSLTGWVRGIFGAVGGLVGDR
jgi:hypothetical protein